MITAKVLCSIFTPFYLPVLGIVILLFFSYLNMLPLVYKIIMLLTVFIFTIILPKALIGFYGKYHGLTHLQLSTRQRRVVPYIISCACYLCSIYIMSAMHAPHFVNTMLITALIIQLACAMINIWWKISTHMAAIGGITGGLMGFSIAFAFNPLVWFCVLMIISGIIGTCRIILRQHTHWQVIVGFWISAVMSFFLVLIV